MSVNIGDKVRIIRNNRFHTIPLGEVVVISDVIGDSVYADYRGYSYVVTGDFENVAENTTLDLLARLSAEVVRLKAEVEALKNRPIEVSVSAGSTPYKFTVFAGGGE